MNHILLVDDEEINHIVISKFFEKESDYQLHHAYNGQEAVDMVSQASEIFDVILMDAMMPDMDGFEASKHIRENNENFIPIIMLTALSDDKSRLKASEAKINDFLTKPVDFFQLKLSLQNFIYLKSLFQEINNYRFFYKTLIDSISDSIIVLDENSDIVFSNNVANNWINQLDLSSKQFLPSLIQHYPDAKPILELMQKAKEPEKLHESLEHFFNIDESHFQALVIPFPQEHQYVLVFKDLSHYYEKTTKLETDLEKRKKDLRKAVFIQKNLMSKKIPLNRKILLKSLYVPSSSIGGDFHAIYHRGKHLVGFIADISGHGIEAALYGTLLFMTVETHQDLLFENTGKFLAALDKGMASFNMGYNFVTALAFRFDMSNNTVYYANAGHNLPYYVLENSDTKIPFPVESGGPPLGLDMGFDFDEHHIEFGKKRFRMIFYTDGLVEDFLNDQKYSSEEQIDSLLYSKNWLDELEAYKTKLIERDEHPDVDDATIIMIEKKVPLKLTADFSESHQVDIIWEKASARLEQFDYRDEEKKKLFVIFQELMSNAIKYGKGGQVILKINPAWSIVRISDRGEGFDADKYFSQKREDKIHTFMTEKFDDYPREDSLGLGLYMVKEYSDKLLYNKEGNLFIAVVKKQTRFTEYYSKYEE